MPDVFLILGSDASGKDHVANVLQELIKQRGGAVERRKRFFSGKPTNERTSIHKTFSDRLQEFFFLTFYPYLGFLIPRLAKALLVWDLHRFKPPHKKLIVVGHNALRALAFYGGRPTCPPALSREFQEFLRGIPNRTNAHTIVLDIDHHVRHERISTRAKHRQADLFDLYALADPERSERIESFLVLIGTQFLKGRVLINNGISDLELQDFFKETAATYSKARE